MRLAAAVSIVPVGAVPVGIHFGSAVVTEERHEQQPKHIEGSDERRDHADSPIDRADLIRLPQNFILAPEAGQRRNSSNRQGRDKHGPKCHGDERFEAAHLAHVLLAADRVNHGACAQKQQALEERMRHQVEDARRKRPHAAGHEHVAKLRDGRVRENFLDVSLRNADGRSKKCSQRANDGHDRQRERRAFKDHMRARNHVDARRHHRSRMDQRRNRRRTFHRVGKPHIERNLRRFAASADHQQNADRCQQTRVSSLNGQGNHRAKYLIEIQRSKMFYQQEQCDQKSEIANAIDDERLLARRCRRIFREPEPDQQIRRQPHPLPANEHLQVITGQHQRQHEKHEQVQIAEEAVVAGIVPHVADRVDVNEESDASDHQQHDQRKLIEIKSKIRTEAGDADPVREELMIGKR